MLKAKVAVLVSGGGTNLQAIIDFEKAGKMPSTELMVVIADKADAYALERAKAAGIKAEALPKKSYVSKADFENALIAHLEADRIDFVVLAGFLTILSSGFTKKYENRILNIHPSLIPKYCGDGFYGLKVHEAVLAAGEKYTGATVHFVTEVVDGGKIIKQKRVKILKGCTSKELQQRVMEKAEWVIFPRAIEKVCKQLIKRGNANGTTKS